MKKQPLSPPSSNRSSFTVLAAASSTVALLAFPVFRGFADNDLRPSANAAERTGGAERFGIVEASGLRWLHLSSRHGDLPVPTTSRQQTAAVVADLDKDGQNDFVLAFREKGPALVWYRRTATGWDRYVIEDVQVHARRQMAGYEDRRHRRFDLCRPIH